jgi:hypothetical protein
MLEMTAKADERLHGFSFDLAAVDDHKTDRFAILNGVHGGAIARGPYGGDRRIACSASFSTLLAKTAISCLIVTLDHLRLISLREPN